MDGEEDLPIKPTDGIENQDPLGPLPTAQPEDDTDIPGSEVESADPTAEVDNIQQTLTEAADAADANSPQSFTPPNTPESPPDPFAPAMAGPDAPPDAVTDESPDEPYTPPDDTQAAEASGPDFADLDATQNTLQSFGEQVNAFNDAGGVQDFGSAFNGGDDSGAGDSAGMQSFADAATRHSDQQDQMLVEYARRLDDMTLALEAERL